MHRQATRGDRSSDLRGIRRRRATWLGLAVAVMVPALVFAQPVARQMKSALYFVINGQTLIVTVAELGDTTEPSAVTIEIRDAADRVRASTSRTVIRGRPLLLSSQVGGSARDQLSVIVKTTVPSSTEVHELIVSMEVFDPASLTLKTLPPCPVPSQMPSGGGGAEGNCDGWHQKVLPPGN